MHTVYFVIYRNIPGYFCLQSVFFVTIATKWSKIFLCRKGKALCERPFGPFALHRQQSETYKQNVDVPPWKISTPGQEASLAPLCPNLRSFGSNVLYWRKYLWHCWDLFSFPAVISRPRSDSAPGNCAPLAPVVTPLAHGKGAWGHSNENLPITAVRNTAERSFSKLTLINTFRRSTMSDKKLTNLAMISIESDISKTLDMTELTKTFAYLQTWKKSFF